MDDALRRRWEERAEASEDTAATTRSVLAKDLDTEYAADIRTVLAEVARLKRELDELQTFFGREQQISEDAILRLTMWRGGGVTLESEGFRVADRIYDNPCLAEEDAIKVNKERS